MKYLGRYPECGGNLLERGLRLDSDIGLNSEVNGRVRPMGAFPMNRHRPRKRGESALPQLGFDHRFHELAHSVNANLPRSGQTPSDCQSVQSMRSVVIAWSPPVDGPGIWLQPATRNSNQTLDVAELGTTDRVRQL